MKEIKMRVCTVDNFIYLHEIEQRNLSQWLKEGWGGGSREERVGVM
jgi:hypothetical protein